VVWYGSAKDRDCATDCLSRRAYLLGVGWLDRQEMIRFSRTLLQGVRTN
jgi:hypothetical protein